MYRIRVRLKKPEPGHSQYLHVPPGKKMATGQGQYAGRMIWVGPQSPPTAAWTCWTDLIWPIVDEELISEVMPEYEMALCRHQIESAD